MLTFALAASSVGDAGRLAPSNGQASREPRQEPSRALPPRPSAVVLERNQFMPGRSQRLILRRRRLTQCLAPRVVDAFDGKVASHAGFQSLVITSPNQDYVPEYPTERRIIKTYSDGLWGVREYSRWPQELVTGMWHIACIPIRGKCDLPVVLWRNLRPEEDWYEDRRAGVLSLGYLHRPIVEELNTAVELVVAAFRSIPGLSGERRVLGDQLCLMLRQCAGRMTRLPSRPGIAVAVGAHVQRLCLELAGLRTYLQVVAPRIEAPRDFSGDVLPVLGTFVHEGSAAQTCTRVGLPTWFLQPITAHIKVWRVVRAQGPYDLSSQESQPPIFHHPTVRAGVMNLTGNWLATMVQGVSLQLCSTTPISLPTSPMGGEPANDREMKRARAMELPVVTKTLDLPAAPAELPDPARAKKKPRPRGGKKNKPRDAAVHDRPPTTSAPDRHADASERTAAPKAPSPPSLVFCRSPFFRPPEPWIRALRKVGKLHQPKQAVLYFYPPPFLLDTVSTRTTLPDRFAPPEIIRKDEKVHRYLHNLVRIRHFCRVRLLDPTIPGDPLTITDWRDALWGDYMIKEEPPVTGSEGDVRRTKRRYDGKNEISRLFSGIATMRAYSEEDKPTLAWLAVSKDVAAVDPRVRYYLLWEAHEISWRCELLALDQVMVPRDGWPVMHRWEREADVSAVWGERSGVIGVLPHLARDVHRFWWTEKTDPHWKSCLPPLQAFLALMSRWRDYPSRLRDMPRDADDWTSDDFEAAQGEAVQYYVETFVKHFSRLPTCPFRFPVKHKL